MKKIGFSLAGLIVFILPMLINMVYAAWPPKKTNEEYQTQEMKEPQNAGRKQSTQVLELIENVTRILYAVLICFVVFQTKPSYKSPYLYLAVIFLVLYYIVWIRYFIHGREIAYMAKSFLGVPIPLAVFPVIYFIFAALWLGNLPAIIDMILFGIVHFIISYQSFHL